MLNVSRHHLKEFVTHLFSQLIAVNDDAPIKLTSDDARAIAQTHLRATGEPLLVYEVAKPRNLKLLSLLELQCLSRSLEAVPLLPWQSELYDELQGVDRGLLAELCKESNEETKKDADERRSLETQNALALWCQESAVTVVHLTDVMGDRVACMQISGADQPDKMEVETSVAVEADGFAQHQVRVSGENLGVLVDDSRRLIASRSAVSISIFAFSDRHGLQLRQVASIDYKQGHITDMKFCPYSFPELLFCCTDGSLHSINLEPLMETEDSITQLTPKQLIAVKSEKEEQSEKSRCVCEYGIYARHLLIGYHNKIYSTKNGHGLEVVVELKKDEDIQCLESTMSNPVSSVHDPFLLAVMTKKRLRLYDLRIVPDVLFSWDVMHSLAKPSRVLFTLENHNPDSYTAHDPGHLLGRLVCGDDTFGNYNQAVFEIGRSAQLGLAAQDIGGSPSGVSYYKEQGLGESLPLIHTRLHKYMGVSSSLCRALSENDTSRNKRAVDLLRYASRLHALYEPDQKRLLPTREISQWAEFFEHCNDIVGFGMTPLSGHESLCGLIVRMNPVGDLIVHGVTPSNKKHRQLTPKVVTGVKDIEISDCDVWRDGGSRIDLAVFEMNACLAHIAVMQPKDVSTLKMLRLSIPTYLQSAELLCCMNTTARSRHCPSLPLILHSSHFLKNNNPHFTLLMAPMSQRKKRKVMERTMKAEMAFTLWHCLEDVLDDYWRGQKRSEDRFWQLSKNPEEPKATKGTRAPQLDVRVYWQLSEDRLKSLLPRLSYENFTSMSSEERVLVEEILETMKAEELKWKRSRIKMIPSACGAKDQASADEMQKWQDSLELRGADIVFLPVLKSESGAEEVKMSFGQAKYKGHVNFPRRENHTKALVEMEALWNADWQDVHKRKQK